MAMATWHRGKVKVEHRDLLQTEGVRQCNLMAAGQRGRWPNTHALPWLFEEYQADYASSDVQRHTIAKRSSFSGNCCGVLCIIHGWTSERLGRVAHEP